MNEIGGYFELSLNAGRQIHKNLFDFNSARNALTYLLLNLSVEKVYLPAYSCDSLVQAVVSSNCTYNFYSLNMELEMQKMPELSVNEMVLYINYYGMKDAYCRVLAEHYRSNLILDYSQSLFLAPIKYVNTIYSPRKFLGVPDGGFLYSKLVEAPQMPRDITNQGLEHIVGRLEQTAKRFYRSYVENERSFQNKKIARMSLLSYKLIRNIDYRRVVKTRRQNFALLLKHLPIYTGLSRKIPKCPFMFPYYSTTPEIRERLIANKIYVPTLWPEVMYRSDSCEIEKNLANNIIPLPIDQRYSSSEMWRIIQVIREENI